MFITGQADCSKGLTGEPSGLPKKIFYRLNILHDIQPTATEHVLYKHQKNIQISTSVWSRDDKPLLTARCWHVVNDFTKIKRHRYRDKQKGIE